MFKLFMKLAEDIEIDDRYIFISDNGKVLRLTAGDVMDTTADISTESFLKSCNNSKTEATELIKNYLNKG